jgi:hypothetical protein
MRHELRLPLTVEGRLDRALADALGLGRAAVKRAFLLGDVRIGGRRVRASDAARPGALVTVDIEGPAGAPEPDPSAALAVLLEHPRLVVVDKPAGVAVHPLAPGEGGTLANAVVARYPECAEASPDPREGGAVQRLVPRLLAGEVPRRPQPQHNGASRVLPRRRPADGAVDWAQPVQTVYNFIRALTRPYPGAFSAIGGRRYRVWQSALAHCAGARVAPGVVLGPVVSPVDEACGQLVACADGSLVLLELESEDGQVLRGRQLSDQPWTGQRWHHA